MSAGEKNSSTASDIERRVQFDMIRYANCWEDADILCEALAPAPGMRILSVASGGDNSMALAAEGAEVVAADLSPAQLACVELKCAAFRRLEHQEILAFLGVAPSGDRLHTYGLLEHDLSDAARAFWKGRLDQVSGGVIHAGKFEAYFRFFRRRIVPLVHRRRTVLELLEEKSEEERHSFYDKTWNNLPWRLLFRVFFSRFVMGRLGRDPEFFRYVEGSVSDRILSRTRYALTVLPTHSNPYLDYILTGNFTRSLPRYLRPEHFERTRGGLDRLTLFLGSVEDAAAADGGEGFGGFNLSDIFEYMDDATCSETFHRMVSVAKPGARLAYWNMLAHRESPPELADRLAGLNDLSERLFALDKAFFYSAFAVEEVR